MRLIKEVGDEKQRHELREWVRQDFDANRHHTEEVSDKETRWRDEESQKHTMGHTARLAAHYTHNGICRNSLAPLHPLVIDNMLSPSFVAQEIIKMHLSRGRKALKQVGNTVALPRIKS